MSEAERESLRRRTWRLLQPGEIDLNGAVVHTDIEREDDIAMHEATVEVGDLIAEAAEVETYVYSGVDDPEFASNQHQGLTVEDDAFVWECQQLLRNGSYDLVFYYPARIDQAALLASVRAAGYEATGVRGDREAGHWRSDPASVDADGESGTGAESE